MQFDIFKKQDGFYLQKPPSFDLGPFKSSEQAQEFSSHLAELGSASRFYYCEGAVHNWDTVETDPYGKITWSVGTDDDFICFDWAEYGNFVTLHATVNSEAGSFIQDYDYRICHVTQALQAVDEMTEAAMGWASENLIDDYDECKHNLDEFRADIEKYVLNFPE